MCRSSLCRGCCDPVTVSQLLLPTTIYVFHVDPRYSLWRLLTDRNSVSRLLLSGTVYACYSLLQSMSRLLGVAPRYSILSRVSVCTVKGLRYCENLVCCPLVHYVCRMLPSIMVCLWSCSLVIVLSWVLPSGTLYVSGAVLRYALCLGCCTPGSLFVSGVAHR